MNGLVNRSTGWADGQTADYIEWLERQINWLLDGQKDGKMEEWVGN